MKKFLTKGKRRDKISKLLLINKNSEELIPDFMQLIAPFDEKNPVPSCRNADQPYSESDFVVTVDGFLVSDNVTVEDALVLDTGFKWSDHNPVYMDFILE